MAPHRQLSFVLWDICVTDFAQRRDFRFNVSKRVRAEQHVDDRFCCKPWNGCAANVFDCSENGSNTTRNSSRMTPNIFGHSAEQGLMMTMGMVATVCASIF